jgi:multidrug efflux pump
MSLSEFFIRRPVGTALMALGILLSGIVSFLQLPVAPLPRVDFPIVAVQARLPGADPTTMAATVAAPLERRLGLIAGVDEMTSSSTQANSNIIIMFDMRRDIHGAARDVQAAINTAGSDLPADLPTPPIYRKVNPSDAPILILAVTSPQLPLSTLYDASDAILAQRISQVPGVAEVTVNGADKPAVRVQANPRALAAIGLDLEDVRRLIGSASLKRPLGAFEGTFRSHVIGANDQLAKAEDYGALLLHSDKSNVLRLSDMAVVKESVENNRQSGWYNTGKAIIILIRKQPDANVIETVDNIKKILPQLESWMPGGTSVSILSDRTQTIRASVFDVELTLVISIVLVVLVVLFALGRFTPTLAACVTVPLSLAATFGVMWLLGFSLDNISLMALTVSVGFVVDDAIVMIENITRHIEAGDAPLEAAIKGAREIAFTVVSITVSLIAVFIPLLFMGGIMGRLFHEFAVTMSVAVVVSLFISLTVTPTLYAHLMVWRRNRGRAHSQGLHAGERMFGALQAWYEKGLRWTLQRERFMLFVMFATVVLTILMYYWSPKGFIPQQDTGMMIGTTEARIDVSSKEMARKQLAVNQIILEDPAVQSLAAFIGSGNGARTQNQGNMYVTLKPLHERGVSVDEVITRLRPRFAAIGGVEVYFQAAQDLRAGGRSSKAQFQYTLTSESLEELREWIPKLIKRLKEEPGITDVSSDQENAAQQVNVVVDRDEAARLGVSMEAVDNILQDAFAQRQVSTIYTERNQYHVVLEASPEFLENESALDSIFVKNKNGNPVRLSSIAHYEPGISPVSVLHQGQLPAATLTFNLPSGMSLGVALDRVKALAGEIGMPPTVRGNFAGNARAFAESLKNEPVLIAAGLLSIYIVLGILYESLLHPLTILSTLPSAGIGALVALRLAGKFDRTGRFDLNLISVIGIILLMGIVKKNGIILVDFAIDAARKQKLTPSQAIALACHHRFRPILMTTLAALLGALPLVFSFGHGSELRQPLGVSIIGGLLVSQLLTLYTTPAVYTSLERCKQRFALMPGWRRVLSVIALMAGVVAAVVACVMAVIYTGGWITSLFAKAP